MEINLKNKNILVTGASRGIGKGLAIGLGKAGARVAERPRIVGELLIEALAETKRG